MITPIDIQSKEFSKSAFGYNKTEVDEFMAEIAGEYEKIYKENLDFKDKISVLNDALKNYKSMEEALKNTLMFAQNTAEDVKKNAKEKADVIISNANSEAEKKVREADEKVFEAERKIAELNSRFTEFKSRFEAIIESQRKMLEDMK